MKLEKKKPTRWDGTAIKEHRVCVNEFPHQNCTSSKPARSLFSVCSVVRPLSRSPLALCFHHDTFAITGSFRSFGNIRLSMLNIYQCWESNYAQCGTACRAPVMCHQLSIQKKPNKPNNSVFVPPDRMPFQCFASFPRNRELGWHSVLMRQPLAAALMNCFFAQTLYINGSFIITMHLWFIDSFNAPFILIITRSQF